MSDAECVFKIYGPGAQQVTPTLPLDPPPAGIVIAAAAAPDGRIEEEDPVAALRKRRLASERQVLLGATA